MYADIPGVQWKRNGGGNDSHQAKRGVSFDLAGNSRVGSIRFLDPDMENFKGEMRRIRAAGEFPLPPERLVPKEEGVKVTITLSRFSVDYFKRAAKKLRTPYQKMIRSLIDSYVARYPAP